jgi:hypothetical protein
MTFVKMQKSLVRGAVVMASLAAVAACGGQKQKAADPSPVVVTTTAPSPQPQPLTAARAAEALATGGLAVRDVPGMRPLGAPITGLTSPTIGGLCGTTAAGLTSEKLRMARRQLVWSAGPSQFVSEERVVYQQGGVQAALKDLLTSSTICPDRIGVQPAPASAKLPAGSMAISSKGAGASMDSYAVPVGNRLLVVLWSNWNGSAEPAIIRAAVAKARTVVVQREQPTLQALAR